MAKSFRTFYKLHMAHAAVFRAADKALKKQEGIVTAHQVILFILVAETGLPSSEIAMRAGMSKSRLTGLMEALEHKGFIRQERGHEDGRQKITYITDAGRAVINRTKGDVKELNIRLLKDFDSEEQKTIQRFLQTAIDMTKDE